VLSASVVKMISPLLPIIGMGIFGETLRAEHESIVTPFVFEFLYLLGRIKSMIGFE
jgi:hypothetical protein